ncbi:MAG: asparagine synthase (glutamine-hydrolyzing) [Bacteroidota bacterium]
MCGFSGIINLTKKRDPRQLADEMIQVIGHRGPDAQGELNIESDGCYISLRHARLSIIDLSENGNQPRQDRASDTIIVFNGEIYNYLELKVKLQAEGVAFDSDTDTEVLLKGMNHWGVTEMLNLVDGMYAFAFLNLGTKEIILARDRFGEKPLYYFLSGDELIFSSQPKAIKLVKPELTLCQQAIYNYFKYSYIPAPLTIYEKVNKLRNGECIKFNYTTFTVLDSWMLDKGMTTTCDDNKSLTFNATYFKEMLIESVRKRCISDVPVCAFLSGGIDSSLTVAIAKKELGIELDTFSMGFDEKEFDESGYAVQVAKEIGLHNEVFKMNHNEVVNIFDNMADIYDEPFCDSSQIPTVFLCKNLKGRYKVALTGDGGDELVFGYPRYDLFDKRSRFSLVRSTKGSKEILHSSQPTKLKAAFDFFVMGDKGWFYDYVIARNKKLSALFMPSLIANSNDTSLSSAKQINIYQRGLFLAREIDLISYLPDELLVKTDRASMYYGLELRTPFLNQDLFHYINATTAPDAKFESKTKLKNILNNYIPQRLIERPKKGFSVPIKSYLKTYLNSALKREISDTSFLNTQGIFNISFLENEYSNLMNNKETDGYVLWSFLVFQKWYRKFMG